MLLQFVQGLYIVAGVLFILSLAGLSKQTTARLGNVAGMIGMGLALVATVIHSLNISATEDDRLPVWVTLVLIVAVLGIGAFLGTPIARKVEMTQMPELIAAFHSFVGMAAVLVGFNSFAVPGETGGGAVHMVEVALGVLIGAYTFTGSVVAYLKLSAKMKSQPLMLPGRNLINLTGFVGFLALMVAIFASALFLRPGARVGVAEGAAEPAEASAPITLKDRLGWIGMSLVPSALLVATTEARTV